MNVQEYVKEDGSSPYQTWFNSLNSMAAVKVTIARSRLEVGNISNVKWFDGIGEYRIDWGPGYRIYLVQDGQDLIVLFGGGTKKRKPQDIVQTLRLHQEYKERKQKMSEEATQDKSQKTIGITKKRKKRG